MKFKVFVDGQEGTTGLEIHQKLEGRPEIEVLKIDSALRKDNNERKRLLNLADAVFLCLPDEAARESVSLLENPNTCVLDASTAHRVHPEWVYGLPELSQEHRARLRTSKRISVPGCHATGFVSAMAPLVAAGLLPPETLLTCFSLTGYSGGGKKLISYYENDLAARGNAETPRLYALELKHKHLPEMVRHTGLLAPPVFTPILSNLYKGMLVTVPIPTAVMTGRPTAQDVHAALSRHYQDQPFIKVMPFAGAQSLDDGYLEATGCNGTNRLELFVFGGESQVVVSARLDNLGKGASGAAIQCMNLHLGLEETRGLVM